MMTTIIITVIVWNALKAQSCAIDTWCHGCWMYLPYSEKRIDFITFAGIRMRVDGGWMVESVCMYVHCACSFRIPPVLKSFLTSMNETTNASLQHHESITTKLDSFFYVLFSILGIMLFYCQINGEYQSTDIQHKSLTNMTSLKAIFDFLRTDWLSKCKHYINVHSLNSSGPKYTSFFLL